ncbi:MAG TPA: oligosaccharide flippase family protein [Chitinophagales bacterium]|nr:oligosaccharide flippase family protein [Chitinophagales bacterium]
MISKKFITSSAIYTFSSALSTVASFLLLPFYTNTRLLNVADFGVLAIYISLAMLVQILVSMSLDFYISVVYHELKNDPEKLREKISSLNGYMIFAAAIVALLFAVGGGLFIKNFVDNPNPASFRYMMMSVATGIFNAHFKFYNSLLVNREKPWVYLWANLFNFVATVGFSLAVLMMFPLTLEGPIWGRFLSCACIFAWSFIAITSKYGIAFKREFIKPTFTFCLPLLLTTIFQWVLSYSDRYIIKPLLFNKQLAIFDLAVRFTLLVNFLIDGLNAAISPRIYHLLNNNEGNKNEAEINKYYSSFSLVVLLLIPLNVLVLPVILPLFIGDAKYLDAFLYLGIVCAGFATRGMLNVFSFPIYFNKKTTRLIYINATAAFLQIALGYLMIRYFKLYGAAFTQLIMKVALIGLYALFIKGIELPKFNNVKMIVLPALVIIAESIPELFIHEYGLKMHLIHLLEAVTIFILALSVYRREIFDFVKFIFLKSNKNSV